MSKLYSKIDPDPEQIFEAVVPAIRRMATGHAWRGNCHAPELPRALSSSLDELAASFEARLAALGIATERDALTGGLTRSAFRRTVSMRLEGKPDGDSAHALVVINLDGFKQVNDSAGYAVGDQLLALAMGRMAFALTAFVRAGPEAPGLVFGRLGGDEFGVLLENVRAADALRAARAILSAVREPFFLSGTALTVGASVGVALSPDHGGGYQTLLRNADLAMYDVKSAGGNGSRLFEASMGRRASSRAEMEAMLREALSEDQFELVFQPQIRVRPGSGPAAAEALLRWHHPRIGIVMPGEFIPVAEQTGLICEIGRWVLVAAIKAIARWQAAGIVCRVAVNLSVQDLLRPDLVGHIQEWFARTGARPDLLEIEVTESTLIQSEVLPCERLNVLRAMGITVAIDDFGTGYSNLSRLISLPIDRLKIDRSLSSNVADHQDERRVVACIVELGRVLGHEIVVEGIETAAQARIFSDMGCDLLQGFGLSRPLVEGDLLEWLECQRKGVMPALAV